MRGKKGVTTLELITTLVMLGILVGITAATMPGMMRRSYTVEATAALNSIRTQMRLARAETGAYNTNIRTGRVVGNVPGFNTGDLTGGYFIDNNYSIIRIGVDTFTVRVIGTKTQVRFVVMTINQDGTITSGVGCGGCGG